ncbi:MAG: hypothetical protein KDJ38_15340, partial [Gammaproteobacteria bacterium]|nr:hypothetical protein [Gammaproteobacteria bacterium]
LRENLGELAIAEGAFSLDFPIWFRAPLQIDRAQGGIGFRFSAEKFEMQSPSLSLANAHVRGESQFYVHKTPGNPAFLDIQAHIDQADASFAHLYYPAERMNPKLVAWLDEAIRAGRLSNGRLQVRGPSKGFPYADGQGDFTASFEIENGRLGFLSDWPEIDAIKARVEFERNSMTVEASDGVSAGNRLSSAHITIDDFKNPVLKMHSGIAGEAADFISYIDRSPLQRILEPVIGDSSMQGALALDLGLEIPLKGDIRKQLAIDGKLDLKKTRWQSKRFGFDLQAIEGPLEFTEKTLTTPGITADYLGQPISVTAAVDKNQPAMFSRISVKGDIDAHEVLKNYKLPIGQWFSGLAPWELTLTARRTPDETNAMQLALLARSRLVGTTVDLPAPYGKPAAMPWPVSVRAEFSGEQQDRFWRFDYGRKITGKARIADGAMDALLIGFNEMLPPDTEMQPGITVSGRVPELSFDGWVSSIAGVIAAMPAAESPGKLMPVTSSLEVDSLKVGKIDAGPARFSGDTTDEYLATRMDSKWLSGNLYYPRDLSDKGKPLKAELALLDKQFLDALTTADGEGSGERIDPRAFPAMDIGVGRFIWDEYQIADMNVRTVPVADGMKTEALGFVHDDLQMFGEAHWRMRDPQQVTSDLASAHRTDVRFRLQSADVGKGLAYIGIGGAFADGEGQVEVELGWDDAAYAPALDEINGTIAIELNKGRILAVEPGAAKILGLFALQAVPRRLLLDFKDVTDEGLLYDNIKGEIDIAHGIAETRLMQLKGPIGIVSSSGSTDFVSGTYDQKISVLPSLTATLPIIGLISAGATAGVGVLVADQVLKGLGVNFDEVGKREYLLSGSWENPLIERIDAPMQGVPQPDNR